MQYLLQLPRLKRQRYFLTQHNPGVCTSYVLAAATCLCVLPNMSTRQSVVAVFDLPTHKFVHVQILSTLCSADWLLNHPNVDILQQQLLAPLLSVARARGAAETALAEAGKGIAAMALPPLLRVQVVTLAPCVSNYTLQFMKEMAFNITEGHTYAGALGAAKSVQPLN